ncbi:3-isopropylmalate dehydrogenase [Ructibacterium gallinarum]|uniref:3-isopropylmalate dehydrogenase n=1 Tax=Ructibacterium gallinarum TaxID=2779355 RepID=A0A9D5R7P4_9FIRM|nr:3-isopropylmalate dehydrogenase [Ructibacterium gallinarum]MBE5039025.1 3-isopropylmalate dehydrogenase [Ructibacterium gallinarum]
MDIKLAVVKGDGIGPEIVTEAEKVLDRIGELYGHTFVYTDILAGGCAIDATGVPLPEESVEIALQSDSVLLGAVGGPKWDGLPGSMRPEKALLGLRSKLGLFANVRPAKLYRALADACPLKPEISENGIDLVIVRELTGGLYFGERGRKDGGELGEVAFDELEYSKMEIERIGRVAFELARKRRKKVTSVDKANVIETSRLWRETMHALSKEYEDVEFEDMLVDNCAMQLVRNPAQFDVIVTENMFGDILSDEASMTTGSIGMLPSSSLGSTTRGMYEPIHGSAPDIAGQNKANPIATILSCAMMLRDSFDLTAEAVAIENAVAQVLNEGWRTSDIMDENGKLLGTREMGDKIIEYLK